MKRIPMKDGHYWCRKPGHPWSHATIQNGSIFTEYMIKWAGDCNDSEEWNSLHAHSIEFVPILPPPNDDALREALIAYQTWQVRQTHGRDYYHDEDHEQEWIAKTVDHYLASRAASK